VVVEFDFIGPKTTPTLTLDRRNHVHKPGVHGLNSVREEWTILYL
jgi:hypothetical protein